MASNILNVVVSSSEDPTIPIPETDAIITPDTGNFTQFGNNIANTLANPVAIFAIFFVFATLLTILTLKIRHIKTGKKISISRKRFTASCAITIISLGLIGGIIFSKLAANHASAAEEPVTITTADTTISINKNDKQYAYAKADITIDESTTDGFDLYAYTVDGNTLKALDDDTHSIASVASTSTPLETNTWGMALPENESFNYSHEDSIWNAVSTNENEPSLIFSTESATTSGATVSVYYGVYISEDLPDGNYTGRIEYKAVKKVHEEEEPTVDCAADTICYSGNGATAGVMNNQTVTSNSEATLIAPNFKRNNYGFVGWSENKNAIIGTDVIYGPSQTIAVGDVSEHGISLYAIWKESEGNLQSWSGCPALTATIYNSDTGSLLVSANSITALTDSRDGNTYAVAKLADGNCWMMENLRLDDSATITTANTNKPATTFTSLPATSEEWCSTYTADCINQGNLSTFNTANSLSTAVSAISDPNYAYGNYYNWYAATAGTGTYATSYGNSYGDICPSGWHLPYAGEGTEAGGGFSSGGFNYLDTQMGGTGYNASDIAIARRWRSFPNNYVFSGNQGNRYGETGSYWSATARAYEPYWYNPTEDALNMMYGTAMSPSYQTERYNGFTVRCIAGESAGYIEDNTLYGKVERMSKGTLTENNISFTDTITTPTTTIRINDTSNSGVFKYDDEAYGVSSDASNDYDIYFYRGVLEPSSYNTRSGGSGGQSTTYPNYVKLANNTCWRIVRTTGSGGVKLIYNGEWNPDQYSYTGTTYNSGTCSNVASSTRAFTSAFNSVSKSAVYAGYVYNGSYGNTSGTDDDKPNGRDADLIFGSNGNLALNNTRSTVKIALEDTWYENNMKNYTSMLEPSAGYCGDRSAYEDQSFDNPVQQIPTTQFYFGAYIRNLVEGSTGPTLNCPRGDVDLYRYVEGSEGLKNELKYPVALLTTDEAALAGSGRNTGNPTAQNEKSFLSTGSSEFWLLSPFRRDGSIQSSAFSLHSFLTSPSRYARAVIGVRPVISFKHNVTVIGGKGTASDPWVIEEPTN